MERRIQLQSSQSWRDLLQKAGEQLQEPIEKAESIDLEIVIEKIMDKLTRAMWKVIFPGGILYIIYHMMRAGWIF
jgi:predicted methyltransferase